MIRSRWDANDCRLYAFPSAGSMRSCSYVELEVAGVFIVRTGVDGSRVVGGDVGVKNPVVCVGVVGKSGPLRRR